MLNSLRSSAPGNLAFNALRALLGKMMTVCPI